MDGDFHWENGSCGCDSSEALAASLVVAVAIAGGAVVATVVAADDATNCLQS